MADILVALSLPIYVDIYNDAMDVDDELEPTDVDDADSEVSVFYQPLPMPLPGCAINMTASAVMASRAYSLQGTSPRFLVGSVQCIEGAVETI